MTILELRGAASPEQVVSLGLEMAMESRYARLGYDDEMAGGHARRMLSDPAFIGYGCFDDDGSLFGFVSGVCGSFLPFTRAIAARQQLLYIAPNQRSPWLAAKLVQTFIDEAKRRGAVDIMFENGTGYEPDRVGKLFEICGLSRVGGLYVMEV